MSVAASASGTQPLGVGSGRRVSPIVSGLLFTMVGATHACVAVHRGRANSDDILANFSSAAVGGAVCRVLRGAPHRAGRPVAHRRDGDDHMDRRTLRQVLYRSLQLLDPVGHALSRREGDLGLPRLRLSDRVDLRARWQSVLVFLVILPILTSVVVRTFAWIVILGRQGVLNQIALSLGLAREPLRLLYTEPGVVMVLAQVQMPLMVLPILTVLSKID